MKFTAAIVKQTTQTLIKHLRSTREAYAARQTERECLAFKRSLVQHYIANAQSAEDRFAWQVEDASLECLAAGIAQELRLLERESEQDERLLMQARKPL
ncbi:MAG: hypothetical protein HY461_00915 [Parcubacteria group bacterium]|nr:hypothetical protein [Parcubacteria group bacterium]